MDQQMIDIPAPKITRHGTAIYYGTDEQDFYLGWVDQGPAGFYGQSRYTDTGRDNRLYGKTRKAVIDQLLDIHLTR